MMAEGFQLSLCVLRTHISPDDIDNIFKETKKTSCSDLPPKLSPYFDCVTRLTRGQAEPIEQLILLSSLRRFFVQVNALECPHLLELSFSRELCEALVCDAIGFRSLIPRLSWLTQPMLCLRKQLFTPYKITQEAWYIIHHFAFHALREGKNLCWKCSFPLCLIFRQTLQQPRSATFTTVSKPLESRSNIRSGSRYHTSHVGAQIIRPYPVLSLEPLLSFFKSPNIIELSFQSYQTVSQVIVHLSTRLWLLVEALWSFLSCIQKILKVGRSPITFSTRFFQSTSSQSIRPCAMFKRFS